MLPRSIVLVLLNVLVLVLILRISVVASRLRILICPMLIVRSLVLCILRNVTMMRVAFTRLLRGDIALRSLHERFAMLRVRIPGVRRNRVAMRNLLALRQLLRRVGLHRWLPRGLPR